MKGNGKPPKAKGMGSPQESWFWDQYRDSKTKPPQDAIYRPLQRVKLPAHLEDLRCLWEEMKNQTGLLIEDIFRRRIVYSKRPAYIEPPYFAIPRIKMQEATLPAQQTAFADVVTIRVDGRHAMILTAIGMDYDLLAAAANRTIAWRFLWHNQIVPLVHDNSDLSAFASQDDGVFSMPLGTFAQPMSLHTDAASARLKSEGGTNLVLQAQNVGTEDVKVRVLLKMFFYRYDHNYEFDQAEYMV